jgi:hypothetical protein
LLSQDEARFPMVPTLQATLGVKGHRPAVGTWDCKDLLYVFAVVNLISGALHSNTPEGPKGGKKKTGRSKARFFYRAQCAGTAPDHCVFIVRETINNLNFRLPGNRVRGSTGGLSRLPPNAPAKQIARASEELSPTTHLYRWARGPPPCTITA